MDLSQRGVVGRRSFERRTFRSVSLLKKIQHGIRQDYGAQ